MKDLRKRKEIMERSIKLGHCICNPKQLCPCDLFKEKNVCLCAGERLEDAPDTEIKLTEYVENAGCASKINQNDLKKVLSGLPEITDPRVLVSSNTCDDAGIYKLDEKTALVQSVDVFTPCVDDPYAFGAIAAANSVSDIYAMGGIPLTALSIVGFPIETLSHNVMHRMIRGGIDKLEEAGVVVLGGHSIKDNEIKFGFAVTGVIDPARMITNDKARPGDLLVLTKPLGTGVISFARQLHKASPEALQAVSDSMQELNKAHIEAALEMEVITATDVTGFGLLGHLSEIVNQSGVSAEIYTEKVPVFDEVLDALREGLISGAVERNREYAEQFVACSKDVPAELETLLYDPQTSGGLLLAVAENKAEELLEKLRQKGVEHAAVIGGIIDEAKAKILLRTNAGDPNVIKSCAQAKCCCCAEEAAVGKKPE